MRKLKKGAKVFLVFFFFGVFFSFFYFYSNHVEKKKIFDIQSHYDSTVRVRKDANIYQLLDSSYSVIGTIEQDVSFSLDSISITDSNQEYFPILDSDYYVYFEDVTPCDETSKKMVKDYYLPLSKHITTLGKMEFYQENEQKFTILKPLELPVFYADDTFYYVEYLNDIYEVKRDKVEIKEMESDSLEAHFISVIDFVEEKDACSSNTCITFEKEKEILANFSESGQYTITEEEYISWLSGNLRLKPGAILISSKNNNLERKKVFQDYQFEIGSFERLNFLDNNQTTQKDTKLNMVNRYVVHQNTTTDDLRKIINGEAIVVEKPKTTVVRGLPDIHAKATDIAVLNYHFFYNPSANEVCNEGNCLDIATFREQLDYLKQHQYKTLTIEEYRAWMYGEIELPARSVLLTIDDGAMGTGTHNGNKLIPLLEEYQMHATLFLISGWWSVDNYQSEYLDIESHTYDMHQERVCTDQTRGAKMLCSSKEEVLNDLNLSIQRIGSAIAFCFPFYAFNDSAIQSLKEVGFQLAFIGGSYKSNRSHDKYKIPRYPIHKNISLEQFMNMIH